MGIGILLLQALVLRVREVDEIDEISWKADVLVDERNGGCGDDGWGDVCRLWSLVVDTSLENVKPNGFHARGITCWVDG